jgi:hypothetical protein
VEGSARALAFVLIAAACGGKSMLYTDGGDSFEGDDAPSPNGGRSGAGGPTPSGGAFTGGVSSGGTFTGGVSNGGTFTGGVSNGGSFTGGVSSGGAFPMGGTGTGGTPSLCADQPGRPPREEPIWWGDDGWIFWENNSFGVQGSWYSANDCASSTPFGLSCTSRDPTLVGPDGVLGWRVLANFVCTRGVAPKVGFLADGTAAYSQQWGHLIGFTLNDGRPWNAQERCVYASTLRRAQRKAPHTSSR